MATIGIMDSGVGGLSVLRELLRLMSGHEYVYYADAANCPYGPRPREWVSARVQEIVQELIGTWHADLVVLACNTATAAAVEDLRRRWPEVPIVGMEPAIKPAVASTRSGVVGVLATHGTLSANKYNCTKERYAGSVKVVEHVGEGFVELVEAGMLNGDQAAGVVERSLRPLLDAGADRIVLGCTHYPFLLPLMQQIAGPAVEFLDPAPAIARRVNELIGHAQDKEKEQRRVTLLSSSEDISVLESLYLKL